ncbi:hypothetical protein [Salipiger abyssi]|uniref:hypothetical protein n=1 Tax=Salipiger abyssi TaxID=1250539 RepID=UPI0012EB15DE|nr:hypothetical protein [Salipiger abyssi]
MNQSKSSSGVTLPGLREKLFQAGVTVTELSDRAELSRRTVYQLFHGKPVKQGTAAKVVRALKELGGNTSEYEALVGMQRLREEGVDNVEQLPGTKRQLSARENLSKSLTLITELHTVFGLLLNDVIEDSSRLPKSSEWVRVQHLFEECVGRYQRISELRK